jgi:glycosyltransferase involved in cell wall biosynthesis
MPVYNGGVFVAESIKSILNQSFEELELIIIDGGSSDNTEGVISQFQDDRLKLVKHNERFGLVMSRNEGLRLARSNLIALQDADDISHRERIERQFSHFISDNKLAVLGTSYLRIDHEGVIFKKILLKLQVDISDLKQGMPMCNGSVMFRKDIVIREGLFNPFFKQCEDYELYCRLSKKGYSIRNLGEFLYFLREHPNRLSVREWQIQALYKSLVYEKYFGDLKYNEKSVPVRSDLNFLYSLLSEESKSEYHKYLIRQYMNSGHPLRGLNEFVHLIKLSPVGSVRLLGKYIQTGGQVFDFGV